MWEVNELVRRLKRLIKVRSYCIVCGVLMFALLLVLMLNSLFPSNSETLSISSTGAFFEQDNQIPVNTHTRNNTSELRDAQTRLSALKMHNAMRFTRAENAPLQKHSSQHSYEKGPKEGATALTHSQAEMPQIIHGYPHSPKPNDIERKIAQWEADYQQRFIVSQP